jgi:geranylgeranyl pyrophosphate synthase
MALIQSRKIEAVVGVSCLQALEAIYPLMESAAVPGIAIPLLRNGCANTCVEADWVWEAIRLTSADAPQRLDLDALRQEVEGWFSPAALEAAMGPAPTDTERLARAWLAKSGKRWRPLLVAAAYQALREDPQAPLPESLRKIALAVECFHKASLVHDDIEDADATRYGQMTLHEEHGVPVALNVGDFLLGEGYRLIAESRWPAERKAEMLCAAAGGHCDLSIGQGAELCWARHPRVLSTADVIDIFRRKTAPAFEVALRLGGLAAGAADGIWAVLHDYSEALGIAYQICDDLKDYNGDGDPDDLAALRPSILLAVACEQATGDARQFLEAVWQRRVDPAAEAARVRRLFEELGVPREARRLLAFYEDEAIRSLVPLPGEALKGLLRRVIFRIFSRVGQGDSLGEPEGRHAPGRAAGDGGTT